ncbi:MAG: CHASE2 domain-containing protein, partial [Verrucomicrobia bacterium]|nr:CHASE2 domain-containing protein [Verrucomicrobiota bacterium]
MPATPASQSTSERRRPSRRLLGLSASVAGAGLSGCLGALLVLASLEWGATERPQRAGLDSIATSFAESLARLSYDLPFLFRQTPARPRVHIVYLDEKSARALGTNLSHWDRRLHTELVRRLTRDGARAV